MLIQSFSSFLAFSQPEGSHPVQSPVGVVAMQHYNTSHITEVLGLNVTHSPNNPIAAGLNMTLGMLFNVVALIILAKVYNCFRRRSKATFLLFASSLVATDLAGHVIPGALLLRRYSAGSEPSTDPVSSIQSNQANPYASCVFLGCYMVFFGLCPLFMECTMAAECCMGVTKHLLHAHLVTTAGTKMARTLIWLLALCVALLPFFRLGAYTYQYPGTWCFIRVMENIKGIDLAFAILFSGLALGSLALGFVCNTISAITLLRSWLRKRSCSQHRSRSHDTEMVVQLVAIMVTSCIYWSPLLVLGLLSARQSYKGSLKGTDRSSYRGLMVTGVRMATCNQILDPCCDVPSSGSSTTSPKCRPTSEEALSALFAGILAPSRTPC
uniref:Thromboxane A2 receptor n=1 Tax=Mola mola TaxID=94237 RepID=A0A3Q3VY07_MOLML